MDQDAPQHPIGIHDQIVEGPPGGGRAGDRLDRLGQVEDQNEAGVGAGLLAKALLLGPHALVAVEVEADRHRTLLAEAPDGLAEQLVINPPAVGGDIAFADADQADRRRPRRGPGPQPGGQAAGSVRRLLPSRRFRSKQKTTSTKPIHSRAIDRVATTLKARSGLVNRAGARSGSGDGRYSGIWLSELDKGVQSMALFGFAGFSLFLVLCFSHCLCDYPLQTDKLALGKCPGSAVEGMAWPYWLAGHAGTHALAVALISGNAWLGLAEFGAHALIDWCKCRGVFNLATDQALHIGCKGLWTVLA